MFGRCSSPRQRAAPVSPSYRVQYKEEDELAKRVNLARDRNVEDTRAGQGLELRRSSGAELGSITPRLTWSGPSNEMVSPSLYGPERS